MPESMTPKKTLQEIKTELKTLLVENLAIDDLTVEDIPDDKDLFGEHGVNLDSLDGVELVVVLHRHYGLDVKTLQKNRDIFQSINTLAPYVQTRAIK